MYRSVLFVICHFIVFTISAQEITVFPGFFSESYYEDSQKISKNEVRQLMKKVPEASALWQKSISQQTGAWIAVGGQFGFLIWQLNRASNNKSQGAQLAGNIGCGLVAIVLGLSSSNSKKSAILTYNKQIKVKSRQSFNFSPSNNGIGISMGF